MAPETPQTLYVGKLKDLYSAESQLLRILPRMAKAASTPPLREALTDHLHQTQVHVHRLDVIFSRLGLGPKGGQCAEMETMIAQIRHLMGEVQRVPAMDAEMIAAVQRFEQFEVEIYESLRTSAEQLGHVNAAASLQESLSEKIATDKKLKELAEPAATGGARASGGKAATRPQRT